METSLTYALELYLDALADISKAEQLSGRLSAMRYFKQYVQSNYTGVSLSEADSEFFERFFVLSLPKLMYQDSNILLEKLYSYISEMCCFIDTAFSAGTQKQLHRASSAVNNCGFKRVLYTKKYLLNYIEYPVISAQPLVLDLKRYKQRKEHEKNCSPQTIFDNGYFRVEELLRANSVVLRKLSSYGCFVRLYLNEEIMSTIRKGDIWNIKLRKDTAFGVWKIEEVNGCYLKNALVYPKLSGLLAEV